ncbi:serine-rich adhesin for platelets-like [Haliotis asinina]|uniref:serine-rich adhesin for platelets-like n=1 Tax=Haliotis asinina TaxID=109174 RepID=UPI003531A30A
MEGLLPLRLLLVTWYLGHVCHALTSTLNLAAGEQAIITSPNFGPGRKYPRDIEYLWNIHSSLSSKMTVTFNAFDLELHFLCAWDYVIVDNDTCDSGTGERHCGSAIPEPYVTSASSVCIRFHSDAIIPKAGFNLTVSASVSTTTSTPATMSTISATPVLPHIGCGADTPISQSAIISSPGYGADPNYPNNVVCLWIVELQVNQTAVVTFESFHLEFHKSCVYDWLKIYDSPMVKSQVKTTLCGDTKPSNITLSKTSYIQFKSDIIVPKPGFLARILITKTMTTSTTNVQSSSSSTQSTPTHSSTSSTTGSTLPALTTSLTVASTTATTVSPTTTLTPTGTPTSSVEMCKNVNVVGDVTSMTLLSPGYNEGQYPLNISCDLTLITGTDKKLLMSFLKFQLEYNPLCIWDSLSLYDGTCNSGKLMGKYCGSSNPSNLTTLGNRLCMNFKSDIVVPKQGFKIMITTKTTVPLIGGIHNSTTTAITGSDVHKLPTTTSGEVTAASPQTSNSPSSGSTNTGVPHPTTPSSTTHLFTPTEGPSSASSTSSTSSSSTQTVSSSERSSTEYAVTLSSSSGEPSAGISSASPTEPSPSDVSSTLSSSSSSTSVSLEVPICSLSALDVYSSVTVTSPNLGSGQPYPPDTTCTLCLSCPHAQKLHLSFTEFDVEPHNTCAWDSLTVYDGNSTTAPTLATLCGDLDAADSFTSSTHSLCLKFVSDFIVQKRGFNATVKPFEVTGHLATSSLPTSHNVYSTSTSTAPSSPTSSTTSDWTRTSTTPKVTSDVSVDDTTKSHTVATTPTTTTTKLITTTPSTTAIKATTTPATTTTTSTTSTTTPTTISTTSSTTTTTATTSATTPTTSTTTPATSTTTPTTTTTTISKTFSTSTTTPTTTTTTTTSTTTPATSTTTPTTTTTTISKTFSTSTTTPTTTTTTTTTSTTTPATSTTTPAITTTTISKTFSTSTTTPTTTTTTTTTSTTTPGTSTTPTTTTTTPATISTTSSTTTVTPTTTTTPTITTTTPTTTTTTPATTTTPTTTTVTPTTTAKTPTITTTTPTTTTTIPTTTTTIVVDTTTATIATSGVPHVTCTSHAQVLTSSSGILISPGFESQIGYPNNLDCKWLIHTESHRAIHIAFTNFELESHSSCSWDSLTVYNGSDVTDDVIAKLCGAELPGNITTKGRSVLLHFHSDRVISKTGFRLLYHTEVIPTQPGQSTDAQFTCSDGTSVSLYQRCDGNTDCIDMEDEDNCTMVDPTDDEDLLFVMRNGSLFPVCFDQWEAEFSDQACMEAGYGNVIQQRGKASRATTFLIPTEDVVRDHGLFHNKFIFSSACASGRAVSLTCQPRECGRKSNNLPTAYILGGSRSVRGEWPWVVSLMSGRKQVCGAAIISSMWVITAGHCVETLINSPQTTNIVAGHVNLDGPNVESFRVTEIVLHPEYNFIYYADIALIRLQRPLVFSVRVKPLCLPSHQRDWPTSLPCFIAGWGVNKKMNILAGVTSPYLHHAKLHLWSQSKCRDVYHTKVKDTMVCAGEASGAVDACKGDSGSPLMCQMAPDKWVQVGITSWGEGCGQVGKPGVYTRVDRYIDWIKQQTKQMESASCSFESPNMCGYMDNSTEDFIWTRRKGGVAYPQRPYNDNTFGNTSGHYMYAYVSYESKNQVASLTSPTFSNPGYSCLTFSVTLMNAKDAKLRVYGISNSSGDSTIMMQLAPLPGAWRMAEQQLDGDVSRVVFVAQAGRWTGGGVGLDDVKIQSGRCDGTLKVACDFDGGTLCEYLQAEDDSLDWNLKMRESKGHNSDLCLEANGTTQNLGDKTRVFSPVLNTTVPQCVRFQFKINPPSSGTLSVCTKSVFQDNIFLNCNIWSRASSEENDWTEGQALIPAFTYPYSIVFQAERGMTAGVVAIDNLGKKDGDCNF